MLKIISVCDLVAMYLKLDFDVCILTHFQASECSWRNGVPAPQVANVFVGEEGEKQSLTPFFTVSGYSFLVSCRCWDTSRVVFPPIKAAVACIEAVWVPSELTQKHLSCLEIAGMVEENEEFSHSVLCFGNTASGSAYLVCTVNIRTSARVILFLFACVRLPKHQFQKVQVLKRAALPFQSHF